jgi:vacuolar protein sorting-associated protein IST1
MFSSGANYNKLKTNLRLCINRLKLLEKKKSEMAMKSRKEIADYMQTGKLERAKIRVEHIIREDYMVEAMEVLEMYCDLLLARFGLIQQMKTLDDGLAEAISSIIWVSPRLQADVQELKVVADQFAAKYGKPYAQACKENAVGTVSVKLMHKLSVQAPPKITVEKYLIEIARYYNVEYEPDPLVMCQDEVYSADNLIELTSNLPVVPKNDLDDNNAKGGGGGGFTAPPAANYGGGAPAPFQYPPAAPAGASAYPPAPPQDAPYPPPFQYHVPPQAPGSPNSNVGRNTKLNMLDDEEEGGGPPPYFPPDHLKQDGSQQQPPAPASAPPSSAPAASSPGFLDLPDLPAVPVDTPLGSKGASPDENKDDDIDFDDLTKRFEALKKKK